jgi:hypothetical protein
MFPWDCLAFSASLWNRAEWLSTCLTEYVSTCLVWTASGFHFQHDSPHPQKRKNNWEKEKTIEWHLKGNCCKIIGALQISTIFRKSCTIWLCKFNKIYIFIKTTSLQMLNSDSYQLHCMYRLYQLTYTHLRKHRFLYLEMMKTMYNLEYTYPTWLSMFDLNSESR